MGFQTRSRRDQITLAGVQWTHCGQQRHPNRLADGGALLHGVCEEYAAHFLLFPCFVAIDISYL